MKKVLILTVTAGGGHNACAFAMKKRLESAGAAQVEIVDIVNEYSTPLNKYFTDKGYCTAVARLPRTYTMFYDKYRAADPTDRYKCPSQGTVLSILGGLLEKISAFKPDVIYSTHFYGSIAVTDLKLICNLPCKCVTCCLDYVNSPFWEAGIGVDYLTIPNNDFIDVYLQRGYERSQLLPFGIPAPATPDKSDKTEARRRLNLNEDDFTVLIMYGGGYWKGSFILLKRILRATAGRRVQIVAIHGKGIKSYKKSERLKKKVYKKMGQNSPKNIVNVGFTHDVASYLAAADVAVTKCGGVSSTEMLNAGLPMIVTGKVPAQEYYNLQYIKSKGAAVSFDNQAELNRIFNDVFADPDILKKMSDCALSLKTNGIEKLADFIAELPEADYSGFVPPDFKSAKSIARKRLKVAYRNDKNAVKAK